MIFVQSNLGNNSLRHEKQNIYLLINREKTFRKLHLPYCDINKYQCGIMLTNIENVCNYIRNKF